MAQNFILDDGSVVVYKDVLDGQGRKLGEQNATEGIGNRSIDAYKRKD